MYFLNTSHQCGVQCLYWRFSIWREHGEIKYHFPRTQDSAQTHQGDMGGIHGINTQDEQYTE